MDYITPRTDLAFPPDSKLIRCPGCGENLDAKDIADFFSCPYCDYKFEKTDELNDFIDFYGEYRDKVVEKSMDMVKIPSPDEE